MRDGCDTGEDLVEVCVGDMEDQQLTEKKKIETWKKEGETV